ncbi:MAG TPA: hypothetical protein ENK31_09910 [Nannocystis exedens]|nr:hypothetical protein [Nannocystis exedens]
MLPQPPKLSPDELVRLDQAVEAALQSGDESGLQILGYGEISSVIAWVAGQESVACKRLPVFAGASEAGPFARYRSCFDRYLEVLVERGVSPVASGLCVLPRSEGSLTVYCVQPRLDPANLLHRRLQSLDQGTALELFDRLLEVILRVVDARVGLDAQLSNWVLCGDELRYLDVTTPMLRDPDGADQMPVDVFLASLPWVLRGLVRRFMLGGILDRYYEPRGVILDLLANTHKERLSLLLPAMLERANARLTRPIGRSEVDRYYASDARDWALLQRLRRLDRAWQRRVRRRSYAFILPGKIVR